MNEMVTIPREEYDRLQAAAEDLADLQSYDRAKAALAAGEEELVPAEYVNRLLNGENALRVYRDLRGLTQAALAAKQCIALKMNWSILLLELYTAIRMRQKNNKKISARTLIQQRKNRGQPNEKIHPAATGRPAQRRCAGGCWRLPCSLGTWFSTG